MSEMVELKGITWDHTRGVVPEMAAAQLYEELGSNALGEHNTRIDEEYGVYR